MQPGATSPALALPIPADRPADANATDALANPTLGNRAGRQDVKIYEGLAKKPRQFLEFVHVGQRAQTASRDSKFSSGGQFAIPGQKGDVTT